MIPQKRVLIIDDNAEIRELLKAILGRFYTVMVATDGIAGVAMALKEKPDVILCDCVMPGMSGLEVIGQLQKNNTTERIPVILMSGRDDMLTVPETSQVVRFLQKPFQPGDLHALIEDVLMPSE